MKRSEKSSNAELAASYGVTVLKKRPKKPYPPGRKLACPNCEALLLVPPEAIRVKPDTEPDGNTGKFYSCRVYTCPECQRDIHC